MQLSCPSCGCAYASDQAEGLCPRCLAAMAMRPSDTPVEEVPLSPGETFHGLQVQTLVARGGMGVVYRARQPKTGRDVALKILPRTLALEEEFRLRFNREGHALAGLSHPNIVNLIDFGIEGDLMFLVMEFVEGVSLRQLLRDKTLNPGRSLRIALDLCEALAFAHREGIIHRDVKPENVLIDPNGRVKLTDFGLAKKVTSESTQLTQTNLAVGTPHYMAPEQLEEPKGIDHRVDVYSMGVVLYEMLVRALPIGRFPAPSQTAGVDPRFDAIVYRCLSKDPNARYGSIAELREALKSVALQALPEASPAEAAPEPPRISGNLEVVCSCGGRFRVPAAARGLVHCPSCGEPVSLKLPAPGTARSTVPIQGMTLSRLAAPRKLLLALSGLAALLALLLILILSPSPSRRPDENISHQPPKAPIPPKEQVVLPSRAVQPALFIPKVDRPLVNPAELRTQIDAAITRCNLSGIVATIFLYSGKPSEYDQVQKQIAQTEDEIKEALTQLEEQGLAKDAPDRFRSGDKISFFGGRRVIATNTVAFAEELRNWLRAFRPGLTERVLVTRGRQQIPLNFSFSERSPELVAITHQVGIVLGETPGYVPPPAEAKPSPVTSIPVATLADIRRRIDALPAFYRMAIPYDDRGRAEALLLAGKGTGDDNTFLSARFSELLRKCEVEQKSFEVRIKELEATLVDPAGAADTVVYKDGHRSEGIVIEESDESFKLKAPLGTYVVERSKVLRIEKGKSTLSEFKSRYEAARGGKTELLKLLAFAREKNLANPKALAAYAILQLDPGDERCRLEVGLQRTPFIASAESDPLLAAEQIEYQGKKYTADQLRQELRSLGYVLMNGQWCEKVPRVFRVDNLYRDEAKMPATYLSTSIQNQVHAERDTVYDYRTRAWIPRTKLVTIARYIGGSGSCLIEIAAPGDLIDCRVHARSQVPRVGGYVSVSIVLEPRETGGKLLFTLSGPGENDGSHDVTEKVSGRNRFYIRADINGDGMFLPSDNNDLNVLEVKYTYAKPLEKANAAFAASRARLDPSGDAKSNNDAVESASRNIALTAAQSQSLTDALAEVRKLMEGMFYLREYAMPAKYENITSQLKDPLFPDWNGLTRDQALKLGSWWGLQSFDERRDFLAAYGIWCARSRYLRGSK